MYIMRKLTTVSAAVAAVVLAGAGIAGASTTITPADTDVTATSGYLTITTNTGHWLDCYAVSGTGNTPGSPDNHNPNPGGIDIDIDDVTLSGCELNFTAAATVQTDGTWQLNANGDNYDSVADTAEGSLFIPAGGATVTAPNCTIEVTRDSTVGPMEYDNATSTVTANNHGTIWYESSGGASYCPPATNGTPAPATLSGELQFSPGVQVTD